ncbi:SMI1/KNR4 family protein [Bacillus sp. FJAT-51639]|uniref:SMI1/KNR4 family protein n=1 Tax=Bacillus bruguierae TaxID=3127667 RepID=A0ABU8FLZ6_9BACI
MSLQVFDAAKYMIENSLTSGKIATVEEIEELQSKLMNLLPEWLTDLMRTTPLCASKIIWQEFLPSEDDDGISLMLLLDKDEMIMETIEAIPGYAVFEKGYISIGSCLMHTGNPYFICIHEGEDPPVYRLVHDYGEETDEIIENRELVADKFSNLLLASKVVEKDPYKD